MIPFSLNTKAECMNLFLCICVKKEKEKNAVCGPQQPTLFLEHAQINMRACVHSLLRITDKKRQKRLILYFYSAKTSERLKLNSKMGHFFLL